MSSGSYSKATTINPKDLLGQKKVSITKFPLSALIHGAHAMMNGASKYGPYNWRAKDVVASIYVDAAMRHLTSWFEREEIAEDSNVHHLAHALACIGILIDAMENGNLVDDRPEAKNKEVIKNLLDRLSKSIQEQTKKPPVVEGEIRLPPEKFVKTTRTVSNTSSGCQWNGNAWVWTNTGSLPIPCGEDYRSDSSGHY